MKGASSMMLLALLLAVAALQQEAAVAAALSKQQSGREGATLPSDVTSPGSVGLTTCQPQNVLTQWQFNSQGEILSSQTQLCLTASTMNGAMQPGTRLFLSACRQGASPFQSWAHTESGEIISTSDPRFCLCPGDNAKTAMLNYCSPRCTWALGPQSSIKALQGPANSCLLAPTILPATCDAASTEFASKFCNPTLSMDQRVSDLMSRLNTSDLIDLVAHGQTPTSFLPSVNLKSFWWDMACMHGVGTLYSYYDQAPEVTVTPMPIALAASFDLELMSAVANMTADEARIVSNLHFTESGGTDNWCLVCNLGPMVNIAHDPRWGRISETFGEDPFLSAAMGLTATQGLQQDTPSLNILETASVARTLTTFSGPENMESFNVKLDNRTLEDTYLPALQVLLTEGNSEGVMASYPSLNDVPNTANKPLLNDMLRNDWASKAYVTTDLGAVSNLLTKQKFARSEPEAIALAVEAGVQNVYATKGSEAPAIEAALAQKLLTKTQLQDMAKRMLSTRFRLGEFDPTTAMPYTNLNADKLNSVQHRQVAREAASASTVLLKNEANILPLTTQTISRIAIIGPNAEDHHSAYGENVYLHSFNGFQSKVVNMVEGITAAAAPLGIDVDYVQGCTVTASTSAPCVCCEPTKPKFADAVAAAEAADVAVLVLGTTAEIEGEGVDRDTLDLPGVQTGLAFAVASTSTPTVLVLVNGGPLRIGNSTLDLLPLVNSVVETWYGGEEAGNGLADILFGIVNPSARLPVTFTGPLLPPMDDYTMTTSPGRTYRYLNNQASPPIFKFGFGLSYTNFMYSQLTVLPRVVDPKQDLHISVNLTNIGTVAGAEVAQVYVSVPPDVEVATPTIALQGFQKVFLNPLESQVLSFTLTPYQLSTVMTNGTRAVTQGSYEIFVGGSQPHDTNAVTTMVLHQNITVTSSAFVVHGEHNVPSYNNGRN